MRCHFVEVTHARWKLLHQFRTMTDGYWKHQFALLYTLTIKTCCFARSYYNSTFHLRCHEENEQSFLHHKEVKYTEGDMTPEAILGPRTNFKSKFDVKHMMKTNIHYFLSHVSPVHIIDPGPKVQIPFEKFWFTGAQMQNSAVFDKLWSLPPPHPSPPLLNLPWSIRDCAPNRGFTLSWSVEVIWGWLSHINIT